MILAQDADCGIGLGGQLPWSPCADDMRFFRRLTIGNAIETTTPCNAVVMGYNTWISIPEKHRPLKNRVNIVLSNRRYDIIRNDTNIDFAFDNWDDVKQHIENSRYSEVWIIGGVEVYKTALENMDITSIYLTIFKKKYVCDKYLDVKQTLSELSKKFDITTINKTDTYIIEKLDVCK